MAEEAPLCRFRRIEIIGRGDGISPKLSKNLHKVRRVGTLSNRFARIGITISRGCGISPNLTQNLNILRQVQTLSVA